MNILWTWITSWFVRKPKTTRYEIPYIPQVERYPDAMRPTKAYADQRQKAQHNRRRKPSKAMRHLYKLR
jgi:hypothetical protein